MVSGRVAGEVQSAADVVRLNAIAAAQMAQSADHVQALIAPIAGTMKSQVRSTAATAMAMGRLKAQIAQIRSQVEKLSEHASKITGGETAGGETSYSAVTSTSDIELF